MKIVKLLDDRHPDYTYVGNMNRYNSPGDANYWTCSRKEAVARNKCQLDKLTVHLRKNGIPYEIKNASAWNEVEHES